MINNTQPLTYQMSKQMFDAIARTRKNDKDNPHNYVMNVINDEFNLRGKVTNIFITNE